MDFKTGDKALYGDATVEVVVDKPDDYGCLIVKTLFPTRNYYMTIAHKDLVPAPKRHTFGGAVFEEVDKQAIIGAGSWYLYYGTPHFSTIELDSNTRQPLRFIGAAVQS